MDDEATLFGDPDEATAKQPAPSPATAAGWQLDLIRKTLDAHGVGAMQDRRDLIVKIVGREVDTLRDLTGEESRTVLDALGKDRPRKDSRSLWDDRDDPTWIDRL